MGNEASMEGEGQAGQAGAAVPAAGAPASISAPPDAGQLIKPSNGAPAGGSGAGPGPGINRAPPPDQGPKAGVQSGHGTGDRLASHDTPQHAAPQGEHGQGHVSRKSLQVDVGGGRTGRSPSVSPDRGSVPTSPYSVPQIAPMPSSKLCPVCKTTDLMGTGDVNTCTQCRSMVCNQCGFNPNPHLTEVQEWLCLNCQMQRALGMDMTTPRSKSQQQIHSPSHATKPELKADAPAQPPPQTQTPPHTQPQPQPQPQARPAPGPAKQTGPAGPGQHQPKLPPGAVPLPGMAKAPSQPDLSRSLPAHHPQPPRQDHTRSAGSSPSRQPPPPEQTFGKLFGFGASLLNQASTLISETTQPQQQPPKPGGPPGAGPGVGKPPGPHPAQQGPRAPAQQQHQQAAPVAAKPRACCPLCKTGLNIGSTAEQPNYNTCTQCHSQVCNMCGFNPTPHLVEKKEWLCLNCQTQRALSGSLGDIPGPVPQPVGSPRPTSTANQQPPQQKGPNQLSGPRATGPQQQQKPSGPQVSGPLSPVKQAGPAPQTKGPSQTTSQTKGSSQTIPQTKGSALPPSQPKGPTQPQAQSKGPQMKGPNQSHNQSKGPVQAANQVKGPSQTKGPTQTKGSVQPTAQSKGPSHPPGGKASSTPGKVTSNHTKAPTPSKTTPTQSKPTGNNQVRKQPQSQEKTKVASKSVKEDTKVSPKKAQTETVTSPKDMKIAEDAQKSRHHEDYNKSSTQSLSDTGYSSDGISSSQGEITGQIREEGIKLSERGASIPSEITKLETSMKPLLDLNPASDQKHRPHSLSVGQGRDYSPDDDAARDESEDDLSCKLRHDYVEDSSESGLSPLPIRQKKSHKEVTDEEFMRRQIMEMSADEEEMEEYGGQKTKKHRTSGDLNKERRRLAQHSNSFEDDTKVSEGAYKANEEDDVMMAGGLRRFKTIELNNTNSYNREMELSTEHDLREPELEMESLTGSPEERSKGEYSSTLPATTPSYTSGTSPTSVSSMEDDSDSSPSRRARLEEAKQQRKARHRSHGPLLPTIEDSSEEDELREEEELLREQEQMRDLEQQRIRSTARKTKRDKEELRAQRRRERSKTPPSNLSPIEDASPTEELRQAAEMEELHRSSCSEYSPSMDSEAEGFEVIGGKLYKSGNEYNLPTFTSLYSPTEKNSVMSPSDKTLKSAEEVYEEMMKKAQLMQRQGQMVDHQKSASQFDGKHSLEAGAVLTPGSSPTQLTAPMSFSSTGSDPRIPGMHAAQHLSKETQNRMMTQSAKIEGVVGVATTKAQVTQTTRQAGSTAATGSRAGSQRQTQAPPDPGASSLTSKVFSLFKGPSPPVSPPTSPAQSPTHGQSVRTTGSSGRQLPSLPGGPTSHGAPTHQRAMSPRLARQQSSQESPVMVITLGSETTSPCKPLTVNSSTSPLSSPTQGGCKTLYSSQPPSTSSPTSPQRHPGRQSPMHSSQMAHTFEKVNVGISTVITTTHSRGSTENISLCKISNISGTSKVVCQGQPHTGTNVVDLRAPMRTAPIIMTDQGMDLTSLASDTRRYSLGTEQPAGRHTAVQPLIMNLNAQEQPHVSVSTPTTVSVTVAGAVFMSQPKQPVIYGDPLQNRVDLGQGVGSAVCLTQAKPPVTDPSIPKIDACLENLGIQQQQLQLQQQKLLQQQQLLEQQLQQHQQQSSFARYNLANQVQPLLIKKDQVVSQSSSAQPVASASAIPRVSPMAPPSVSAAAVSNAPHEIYGGIALELKNKPTVVNLSTGKPHVMMVQLDDSNTSQGGTVTQIVKQEEPPPPPKVLDLTGQIKPENQVACCDVVYKLPFAGSCSGSFTQKTTTASSDKNPTTETSQAALHVHPPHYHVNPHQHQPQAPQGVTEEHKTYQPPTVPTGRIQPSMSDTNLPSMTDAGHYQSNVLQGGPAIDLSTMNQGYDSAYLGMGAQYGSYTDLRHQGDIAGPSLPLRRYGSMSNINSDYPYTSRDLTVSQDSNLAQYSATTAREISRMCAALNTVDQFGSRYGNNPEVVPYGAGRGGSLGRLNLQQSLASIRANLLYGPDGRPTANGQTLTNLINARQASIRALYPAAMRGGDGMIYSTINTPIASTLPITTQPASVLRPMPRGIYRPYPTGVTAVPLASLTRLPHMTPRMPLSSQSPYSYPSPNQYPTLTTPSGSTPAATSSDQESPMYLGKPITTVQPVQTTTTITPTQPSAHLGAQNVTAPGMQTTADQQMDRVTSLSQAQGQISTVQQKQAQMQPQQFPAQTEPLSLTQTQALVQPISQTQPAVLPQSQPQGTVPTTSSTDTPKTKEDERLSQQQEHMLQLERERVELEKLRQLRLHEELERDRMELQRHREKEQLLVQREIQELQTIKQQVLQQQQAERETQLIMQREQLAQQRMQLEQIQSLQQQLQQQLEEQKRQKTAAVEAAAAAAAAEAAAASAAAAAAATSAQGAMQGVVVGGGPPQGFIICDQSGRVIQQDGQSVQFWQDGQVVQAVVAARPIHSSVSEMSLRSSDKQTDPKIMKKQNSMPRLRDGSEEDSVKRITDSCVQTDDEDGEERYINRRRRTRRIADCSVQTDEEDQGEWDQQPVRRRRSRVSKHSEPSGEAKSEGSSKVASASIAIQTTNDSSCQTESDQLGRVSPAIHITMAETSKVDLLHYIAAPERTHKGESLACQTEPECHSQGVVAPQLSVPTTISPYSTSLHIVGASDPTCPRLQGVAKFERRKPDPLEIGYQQQQNDSPSRQPPKSPQVLYSPVSPLSPHRMLETTFASQEKLNKAHVTPQQKAFTAESPQRHQTLPRPIKSVQRSMSDPKPLSPTSEDPAKSRFSPYSQQGVSSSQMASLQQQQNSLMRKIKRTLPSPPPDETPLPIVTPAQMYSSSGMPQRVLPRPAQGVTKAGLLSELKAVEQESSKLRKQQAELEEEEKEIDAKLRYLELGITQRKETMVKERERRELAYLRCMGDARDYMSDSELNNLRMAAATGTFDANGLLTRPSTAPLSQFTNDLNATSQYPSTSSYMTYPYPQSQSSTQQPGSAYQQIGFQPPQYPSSSAPQPGTFQPHPPPGPGYQNQGTYSSCMYAQPYQADLSMQQHGHQGFHQPGQPVPAQNLPYPSHSTYQPGLPYPPQAEILTVHQRPRQTSLADLEQKFPTNYEVISNPAVSVATSAPDTNFGSVYNNAYGQYRTPEPGLTHGGGVDSPTSAYASDGLYTSNLEQNIPRNYVMIDDISELTKDNTSQPTDALGHPVGGRYRSENGPTRGSGYGRPEDEVVDAYGRHTGTTGYQSTGDNRTSTTVSGSSSYYYDDYKHTPRGSPGSHKVTPKNLAPAVVSSKRSKHRKQGMEQKISKFSPIEEARDVESDLASYTMTTSTGGSCTVVSRSKKLQDDVGYGMKKNAYDQQKYYGTSREGLEEEERMYSSGRSRSTGYGMDKISSRDSTGHRSKSYERDAMERSQRRSGRPPMRNQNSEEESPLSPVGKPVGMGRPTGIPEAHDVRNQYGSSHSLPDVQDHHKKDLPRSHVFKPDDPYLVDDMHCAVSDSEAYHLGQEETDWFEKPREARSDRSRHHGSGGHSSTGRRSKHTYHDYDEPPEEYCAQDEYNQRHPSSTSTRDHRHHSGSSGRHSSSRHTSEDSRSSRSSRTHPKDPSGRSDGRSSSSTQRRSVPDPRSAQGSPRNSGDFSRDTGHHHSGTGGRGQRTQGDRTRRQDPAEAGSKPQHQQPQQQPPQSQAGQQRLGGPGQRHSSSEPLDGTQQAQQQHQQQQSAQQQQQPLQHSQNLPSGQPTSTTAGAGPAQQQPRSGQTPPQGRQPAAGSGQPATTGAKMDTTPAAGATGVKPTTGVPPAPQPSKIATPPLTGIGSKAAPVGIGSKPGGIGSAAPGQTPAEGENVLTKILQGGAAEQAGKLGDALSGLGKKFTSFW
ncbi:protein bassoon isoform X2 [Betta splendens]|uniref:Protein bassoon isoform X2 n=1 Tax=Betta splendens TaxID=158456 RepID=A0A6P7MJ20_BETSP|nr:protein bassoon isoform X2 [Betta splendens]